MRKPPPPDFTRGWAGSRWFDPTMTAAERADVEAIVAGVGMYVPRPPPREEPRKAEPEAAVEKPKPAPPPRAGRRKRRDDDGPTLF